MCAIYRLLGRLVIFRLSHILVICIDKNMGYLVIKINKKYMLFHEGKGGGAVYLCFSENCLKVGSYESIKLVWNYSHSQCLKVFIIFM